MPTGINRQLVVASSSLLFFRNMSGNYMETSWGKVGGGEKVAVRDTGNYWSEEMKEMRREEKKK